MRKKFLQGPCCLILKMFQTVGLYLASSSSDQEADESPNGLNPDYMAGV